MGDLSWFLVIKFLPQEWVTLADFCLSCVEPLIYLLQKTFLLFENLQLLNDVVII